MMPAPNSGAEPAACSKCGKEPSQGMPLCVPEDGQPLCKACSIDDWLPLLLALSDELQVYAAKVAQGVDTAIVVSKALDKCRKKAPRGEWTSAGKVLFIGDPIRDFVPSLKRTIKNGIMSPKKTSDRRTRILHDVAANMLAHALPQDPATPLLQGESSDIVRKVLYTLDVDKREIIVLDSMLELSQVAIADILDLKKVGTVKSRINRAQRKLKIALNQIMGDNLGE